MIYADFEAFLNSFQTCSNDPHILFSNNVQKHEVNSFGYYVKCSFDDSLSKYKTYSGGDCSKVFIEYLIDVLVTMSNINRLNTFQMQRFVPIILHNLSNYDAHFIVHG